MHDLCPKEHFQELDENVQAWHKSRENSIIPTKLYRLINISYILEFFVFQGLIYEIKD